MTEEEIGLREAEIKAQFPDMFNDPEIKEGECFLEMVPAGEFLEFYMLRVQEKGLTSVRSGRTVMRPGNVSGVTGGRELPFAPLFVNLREAILLENTLSKKSID